VEFPYEIDFLILKGKKRLGGGFHLCFPKPWGQASISSDLRQVIRRRVARRFLFRPKNPNLGMFLEDLGIEIVVAYSGHLEYFTTIRYRYFMGKFVVIWYSFS
jgi:hypothetical protein